MPEAYKWIGPLTQFECPGSPDWTTTRFKQTVVCKYSGPYDLLQANKPLWGVMLPGLPGLTTENVHCAPDPECPASGILTVTLSRYVAGQIRYRRYREEVQKRIETHPRYVAQSGQPGAFYENTPEMMFWLQQALADEQSQIPAANVGAYRTQFVNFCNAMTPKWTATAASENAGKYYLSLMLGQPGLLELWNKIKAGRDSYLISVPVVEEERRYNTDPGQGAIDVIEAPPAASNYPSGYVWMKRSDEAEEEAESLIWVRKRRWMGFDYIDVDLYA